MREGGGPKDIIYHKIRIEAGCPKKTKKRTETNRGKEGAKIGNFDHTYFLNVPLVGLPFVMVKDGDCHGDCNGLQ